jgi:hypothetical protein
MSNSEKNLTNPWDLDSGLPDKVTAKITNSEFGFKSDYQNGEQPLLILTLEGADFDPFDVAFSLGKDWKIVDNGKRIESTRGKQHLIKTSMYGRFIDRVVNELKVPVSVLKVSMPESNSPLFAEVWLGLIFYWEREELDFGKGIMSEKGGKTVHLMPVTYLPNADVGTTAKSVAQAIAPELETKLAVLAKASPDHLTFFKAAVKVAGVSDNTALLNSVMDDSANGFYSKHK